MKVRLAIATALLLTLGCSKGTPPAPAPSESKPAETKPAETKAPETKPAETQPATTAAEVDAGAPVEAEPTKTPDIEYVPTPDNVVTQMLEAAEVTKDDVVYDLGCGDGRIVVEAAKRYGARGFGYDVDPKRIEESRANAKKAGVEHLVTFEQKDIFELDLSPASVVTLYLLPKLNVRLIPQLEKLRPGSRIVSHDFDMKGVEPEKYWTVMAPHHRPPHADREHYVYLWKVPLKKVPVEPDEEEK